MLNPDGQYAVGYLADDKRLYHPRKPDSCLMRYSLRRSSEFLSTQCYPPRPTDNLLLRWGPSTKMNGNQECKVSNDSRTRSDMAATRLWAGPHLNCGCTCALRRIYPLIPGSLFTYGRMTIPKLFRSG